MNNEKEKEKKGKQKGKRELKYDVFSNNKVIPICHSEFDGDIRCQLRHYCSGVVGINIDLMDTLFSWTEAQSK